MNDDLVTRVARGMTDVEVPASFRARVVGNLGRQTTPVRWHRLAMGAAAAALLILAIWVPRESNVGSSVVTPVQHVASVRPPDTAKVPAAPETALSPRRATQNPPMSADELAWLARRVAPLAAPEPLVLGDIQPTAATIAPMIVEPIDTAAIEIAALDPRSGGRH
jgi:hypothetical protein